MSKPKKKNIGSSRPATKGDIEQLREDFQADLTEHTVSKKEFEEFRGKFEGFQEKMETMEDRVANRVVSKMKAYLEQRDAELQGAHEDELATVEGKKDAPKAWKSIPRRLKATELEIDKIKDHLEIG